MDYRKFLKDNYVYLLCKMYDCPLGFSYRVSNKWNKHVHALINILENDLAEDWSDLYD